MKTPFLRGLLFVAMLSSIMAAQPLVQIPDELKPYVTLVTSNQPEFRGLVESLLAPQQLADNASVVPYGVVIKNISSAPLRGYGIAFVQQPPTGKARLDTFSPVDMAVNPLGMFQPGQSIFHIPGMMMSPSALPPGRNGMTLRLPSTNAPSVGSSYSGLDGVAQRLASYSSITISVEYVITQAGKIIGPDSFKDALTIQAGQQALCDLADRIKSHGNDVAGLTADLKGLAQTKVTDRYTSKLRSTASMLWASVSQGSDPADSIQTFLATEGSGIIPSR